MVLSEKDVKVISSFVKKEPRSVQDIAKHIQRSWLTTDAYIAKIMQNTGQLQIKVFRAGTQGALKIVYWNYEERLHEDEIKKMLYDKIRLGRARTDFDPFEIYQHIASRQKKAVLEIYTDPMKSTKQGIISFLEQTEQELFCFTGNMSWLHLVEDNIPVLRALEDLLKRKVHIRMVGRVDLSVMENLNKISRLLTKYAGQIEIHHAMQPLRGFIIDNKVVRLKDEKEAKLYRKGELKGDLRVFYDIYDPEWIYWIQQVFWNLYRGSPTAEQRIEELKKIF